MTVEFVEKAQSAQVLLDYLQSSRGNFAKPFEPQLALTLLRNDPLVKGIIRRNASKVMEGGWGFHGSSLKERKAMEKKFKKSFRFQKLLRNIATTMQYQDVLIEIVKEGNVPKELNLLDPAVIEVKTKSNGDVDYYFQSEDVTGKDIRGNAPRWNADRVVHIKYDEALLNVWGENQLKSAYDTLLIKDYIRTFILWLFKTNQFRTHYNFKSISEQQVKDFVSRLRQGESDYSKPVLTEGELTASPLRELKDLEQVMGWVNWCDDQLVALLGQTAVGIGAGGSGGRSESDSLGDVHRSTILDMQEVISEGINFDLMEKMGYPVNEQFYFAPLDRMTKRQLMETIEVMRRSGWTDKAIMEFAKDEGLEFELEEWFNPPETQNAMSSAAKKDGSFSRQRSAEGQADKNVGTGKESTTRQDQLVSKAKSKYDSYPYTYEVSADAL